MTRKMLRFMTIYSYKSEGEDQPRKRIAAVEGESTMDVRNRLQALHNCVVKIISIRRMEDESYEES